MTRIAIVGSRTFERRDLIVDFVISLPADSVVVSGGAPGVDSWAVAAAAGLGLGVRVHPADWDRYGRKAGPIRNAQIVGDCDRLVAFWDGQSRGTLNTLVQADLAGVPIKIIGADGSDIPPAEALAIADEVGITAAVERASRTKPN